jgi:hypothetical protein
MDGRFTFDPRALLFTLAVFAVIGAGLLWPEAFRLPPSDGAVSGEAP